MHITFSTAAEQTLVKEALKRNSKQRTPQGGRPDNTLRQAALDK